MKAIRRGLATGALLSVMGTHVGAGQIDFLIGDVDNLGGEVGSFLNASNETVHYFVGPFDHRSAAEKALGVNEYYTDWAAIREGTQMANPIFQFNYSPIPTIASATLTVGIGGAENNNESLYLDDQLVSDIFPIQPPTCLGPCEKNIFGLITNTVYSYTPEYSWDIPAHLLANIMDGQAEFRFNFNRVNDPAAGDYVVIDYVRFTINTVPEPGSVALLAAGLLGLSRLRQTR